MSRIRTGGQRLRAGGGRTRKEDCCCVVTCTDIGDTDWREDREVSYEIFGVTVANGCAGTCLSEYAPSGVLPYDGVFTGWPGSNYNWHTRTALTCSTCGGVQCYYHVEASLNCFSGNVSIGLVLRVANFAGGGSGLWDLGWFTSMAEGAFSLGAVYTLTGPTANINGGPCQPSAYVGSTVDVSFS
jgi:hypothetical protein